MPDTQGPGTLRRVVQTGTQPVGGARRVTRTLTALIAASAILVATPAQARTTGNEVAVVDSTASSLLLQTAAALDAAHEDKPAQGKKRAGHDMVPARLEALQTYISGKYRVQTAPLRSVIETAWNVGGTMKLDPLLLLAVMAIESSFDPRAESGKGAQGLMQVMTRVHRDKFAPYGGAKAAWHPEANIHVGAQILRDCIDRRGSVPAGLTCYVGSTGTASAYGRKVLAERDRLRAALLPERLGTMTADATPAQAAKPAARQAAPAPTRVAAKTPERRETTLSEAAYDGDISREPVDITASLTLREVSALEM